MQLRYVINLHKGLTPVVVAALMWIYGNGSVAAWVYLALHGTYGLLWLLKDWIYPDRQWQQPVGLGMAIAGWAVLALYWLAPFLLISSGVEVSAPILAGAVALNILGVFLHYVSDAQKYYTLRYHKGLIDDGLFARSRNTNYLGEILIYVSFALLSMHWQPFVVLAGFFFAIFLPNMRRKDESLSRYDDFEAYRERSGLLLPKLSALSSSKC
jgi:protein-S-isoprenylcysteine O-methyltransferase Ste14